MAWLDLLHIADSSFPIGAYVHSSGLETLAPADLEASLSIRVSQSLARFELVFLLHAYTDELRALDHHFHTMLFAHESRAASSALGTNLLRAVCDVVPSARLLQFLHQAPHRHHPIAFGAVCASLSVPPPLAASTYAFQSLRSLVSAAQRLGRLGQWDAQRVLQRLKPGIQLAVQTAAALPLEQAGAFTPAWDIAAMAHERAPARMFAS
jgi:urease accessory protein